VKAGLEGLDIPSGNHRDLTGDRSEDVMGRLRGKKLKVKQLISSSYLKFWTSFLCLAKEF